MIGCKASSTKNTSICCLKHFSKPSEKKYYQRKLLLKQNGNAFK